MTGRFKQAAAYFQAAVFESVLLSLALGNEVAKTSKAAGMLVRTMEL